MPSRCGHLRLEPAAVACEPQRHDQEECKSLVALIHRFAPASLCSKGRADACFFGLPGIVACSRTVLQARRQNSEVSRHSTQHAVLNGSSLPRYKSNHLRSKLDEEGFAIGQRFGGLWGPHVHEGEVIGVFDDVEVDGHSIGQRLTKELGL